MFFLVEAQWNKKFLYRAVIKSQTVFIGDNHERVILISCREEEASDKLKLT